MRNKNKNKKGKSRQSRPQIIQEKLNDFPTQGKNPLHIIDFVALLSLSLSHQTLLSYLSQVLLTPLKSPSLSRFLLFFLYSSILHFHHKISPSHSVTLRFFHFSFISNFLLIGLSLTL